MNQYSEVLHCNCGVYGEDNIGAGVKTRRSEKRGHNPPYISSEICTMLKIRQSAVVNEWQGKGWFVCRGACLSVLWSFDIEKSWVPRG